MNRIAPSLLVLVLVALAGCQSAYYGTMEKFGYHKRDLLVNRVEKARDAQEEAVEQFESALDRFMSVVNTDGGALEQKYRMLDAELERSEARALEVTERIDAVEDVAEDLFDEWEDELDQYSDSSLRSASGRQMRDTRRRYDRLIVAMRRAEAKIEPVLTPFRDQVLFLKHNLNAQAIASLQGELSTVETNVDLLIRDMRAAIAEADAFIRDMGAE
jgi:hypothetical protein